jgi:hypothetical protein
MRLDGQIGFEDIDDNYKKFVDKFKPKKTTDDISRKAADRLSVAYAQATKNKARKVEEPEDGAKFVWELSAAERAAVEYLGREKE